MSTNFTPVRFFVTPNCSKTGGHGDKAWRVQCVMVHQGDEVRKHEFFLRDGEKFLDVGEVMPAPDALYLSERSYVDKGGKERKETRIVCANRFVPYPKKA